MFVCFTPYLIVEEHVNNIRDLSSVTDEELIRIREKQNHRPRKCLVFKKPFEVFFEQPVALIC
jgi:IS30 family transposase